MQTKAHRLYCTATFILLFVVLRRQGGGGRGRCKWKDFGYMVVFFRVVCKLPTSLCFSRVDISVGNAAAD